jgi:C4-dicarboxylate-specific signal transduction histidine kinase
MGISILFDIMLAAVLSGLMVRGILPGPFVSLFYLFIVLAMAFELSMDLIHTRQLSRKLTESEERMRLAARAADLGLWDWDIVRDEIWINDFGTGRIAQPASGSTSLDHYMELVHPVDRRGLREALDRAIENDEDFQVEFRMGGPNGEERWIAASGQVERDALGEPLRLRGIALDITTQKQSENALERSRSVLTHTQRVSAMGQLSMSLAHELNQPLGAILRNAEAGEIDLRHDPLDLDELRAIFVDIQNDGQRAAEVINRMRALLRYRELRMETIALPDLIKEIENVLTPELKRRHVTLHTTISDKLQGIRGDRIHLQQVLLNLIINSMDAMETTDAAPRHIEILAGPADKGQVELAVKDTGAGFDPDQLRHLFEAFYTTKSDGMGMGLAICKTIVESHGGRIRAKNNKESGACVSFTLPVDQG